MNCLCDADAAYLAMKMIYEHYSGKSYDEPLRQSGKNRVKAIHYIQSFSPDEDITPEQAHQIAKAFVRKTFGDDVQVVIATHCDKAHVHSHIVINSYSVTGRKYYDNWNSREHAREYSDRVCQAFGIMPLERRTGGKGIKYIEWEHRRRGTSWKQQICTAIDSLIPSVKDIDELYTELIERGYEIKHGKYTSIRAEGQQRFVRLKTLGEDYTEDNLRSRILWRDDFGNALLHSSGKGLSPIQSVYVSTIERLHVLITEGKKIPHPRSPDLPYLPNNDRDVYIVSAQLSILNRDNIDSIEELEGKMERLKDKYESAMKEINALTAEHSRLEGIISQAEQYFELLEKLERSQTEEVMLNLCRRTALNNSIHGRSDLDRLKKTKAEQ
ncbi:MAG: relaxase/mobilization nuclease domain-containing protein, partial [Ruminiclostridium sp.]|nr:relaxase/mobilization nuclease domain-containing protein [Ruminiclostridium sp.]